MSVPMPLPTVELAGRILAKCSYDDRMPAGRLTSRLGITRGGLRGLPDQLEHPFGVGEGPVAAGDQDARVAFAGLDARGLAHGLRIARFMPSFRA